MRGDAALRIECIALLAVPNKLRPVLGLIVRVVVRRLPLHAANDCALRQSRLRFGQDNVCEELLVVKCNTVPMLGLLVCRFPD